jgi:hypothetical protein
MWTKPARLNGLTLLLLASSAAAGFFGGGLIAHGHSSTADGGRITNLSLLGNLTVTGTINPSTTTFIPLNSTALSDTSFATCNVANSTVTLVLTAPSPIEIIANGRIRVSDSGAYVHVGAMLDGYRMGLQTTTRGIWGLNSWGAGVYPPFNTVYRTTFTVPAGTHSVCLGAWVSAGNIQFCTDTSASALSDCILTAKAAK